MHSFSCVFHAFLCSYTFYSSWRTSTYTTRSQQQLVPQSLHLKWYIKATCLRILHMIDVSNDSVFSVWKSYVCFSPHLRSTGKENARASKQKTGRKKDERQCCYEKAHTVTKIWTESNTLMGRTQSIWQGIKWIILTRWSSELIRGLHTMIYYDKQRLFLQHPFQRPY